MPSFTTRLADGFDRVEAVLELAFVPLVVAFFNVDAIQQTLASESDFRLGVEFSFPSAVVDVWAFVNVPREALYVGTGGPEANLGGLFVYLSAVSALAVTVLMALLQSVLTAGYLGSLRQQLATGSYDFGSAVRRYSLPLVAYQLAKLLLGLTLVTVGVLAGSGLVVLVLAAIPLYFVLAYLFYPVPYLVVLREQGFVDAIRGSVRLAVSGESYFAYALGFMGFVALVSAVGTAVVANLGMVGIVVGAIAAAPLGLALNVTTLRFLADIDDASPTFGEWETNDGGASPSDSVTPTE
ncbi:hypothetical protein [Halogranum rubrum]|uniref:Glycerophosphoryl diester phosphodiesterase membrane domain-containing protein n=1 Tax=Halogranum salarium B-1 TaxID=1210908 RepID=J3A224_9EURY|nr:hypothetical protein [Halogranum salarium]EJN59378.1 hypothetical protein HSB1_27990 [Halogranum salarium B-1]